jgi:S-formylglutathione hydrolase FrmB
LSAFRTIEVSDPRFERDGLRAVTFKSRALGTRADLTLFGHVRSSAAENGPLPVVLLLHGVYGSHWAWALKGGAHHTAARLIEQGAIPPMILAMPSDGLWGDGSGYVRHAAPAPSPATTNDRAPSSASPNPPAPAASLPGEAAASSALLDNPSHASPAPSSATVRDPARAQAPPGASRAHAAAAQPSPAAASPARARDRGAGPANVPPPPDVERYILDEVPAAVAEAYPGAVSTASPLFIAGLSMGGFGALKLGAKHPRRFAGVAAHSAITHFSQMSRFVEEPLAAYGPLPEPEQSVLHWMTLNRAALPPLRFDCGLDDPQLADNRQLHAALDRLAIPHTYAEPPGGHAWPYWERHLEDTLRFFAGILISKRKG